MNNRPKIMTVRDVADRALHVIAQGDLGKDGSTTKERVLGWYKAKMHGTVDEWLLAHSVAYTEGRAYADGDIWDAIATKHPYLLRKALSLLRKVHGFDYLALQDIEGSTLPEADKKALLTEQTRTDDFDEACSALWAVHAHNREAYDNLLLKLLAKAPRHFDRGYAYLSGFAIGTQNPKVWKELDEVIARAETPMKICLLQGLGGVFEALKPDIFHKLALPIFRKYFNDSSRISDAEYKAHAKDLEWYSIPSGEKAPTVGSIAKKEAAAIESEYWKD